MKHKPHPKSKFTSEEDEQLKSLVDIYGENWNLISEKMGSRNPRQCRDRYLTYLSPNVNSSPWTPEDDLKLQQLHLEYGPKWVKISRHFENRTDTNIKNRWMVLQRQKRGADKHRIVRPVAPPQPQPQKQDDPEDVFNAEVETDLWDDIMSQSAYDFSCHMQRLERTKDKGLKRLKQQNYKEALTELTSVIDALTTVEADPEAILKCECLIGRSACRLAQGNKEDALKDADEAIAIYKQLRPEDKMKDVTPEQLLADPFTPVLSRAYVRRGKIREESNEFLDAFHEYAVGLMFDQKGEAQTATRALLHKLSIPDLDQSDKDLQPFSVLLLAFCNEADLVVQLTALVEYLQKTELSQELVKKFDEHQCPNLLYGLMQLYIENDFIVVASLTAIRIMGEKGVHHIFDGILVTRIAMITWSKDEKVMGEAIKLLRMSPPELFNIMAKADFIPLIVDAMKLPLTDEEIESAFFIIFRVASHPSLLVQAAAEGVIDVILEKKTVSALMLLSKICMIPDIMQRIEEDGGIDWAISMMKENPDKGDIGHATIVILARSLLNPADPNNKEKLQERGRIVFDVVTPFLLKKNKDPAVVADAFSAIALATEHAPEKVKELKLVTAASAMLAIHMREAKVVQNIIAFFYECTQAGLVDYLKEMKQVLPTAMKALQAYADNEVIVERAVTVAVILDHPNKENLLQSASMQYPQSKLLKQVIASMATGGK